MDSTIALCKLCRRKMFTNVDSDMVKTNRCSQCRRNPSWFHGVPGLPSDGTMKIKFGVSPPGARVLHLPEPVFYPEEVTQHNAVAEQEPVKMKSKPESNGIAPGQVWRSLDPRDNTDAETRYVIVDEVDGDLVKVRSFWGSSGGITRPYLRRTVKKSSFKPTKGRGFERSSHPVNPHNVQIGQIWRAVDPRRKGATITIRDVDFDRGVAAYQDAQGKTREVQLTSFTKAKGRGYELVRDA